MVKKGLLSLLCLSLLVAVPACKKEGKSAAKGTKTYAKKEAKGKGEHKEAPKKMKKTKKHAEGKAKKAKGKAKEVKGHAVEAAKGA